MNNRLLALRQRLNLTLPDLVLLASALLMLVVFWSSPWQTIADESLTAAAVLGQALEQGSTPALVLIPIVATLAGLLALWGLSSTQYKRLTMLLILVTGMGGLLYYASVFFFPAEGGLSAATLGTTGLGFWLALIAAAGLIVQYFLPRDEEIAPLSLDLGVLLPLIGLLLVGALLLRAQFTVASGGYNLETFVRQVIFGSAQGSVYALIALGYTLVYGILFMINFAHGEVFMGGAYVGFFFIEAMNQSGFLDENTLIALLIVFIAAIATSILIAIGLERIAYRPLRTAPRLVPLITAIGASIFLQQAFRGLFGSSPKVYPNVHFFVLPQLFHEECEIINGAEVCRGLDLVSGRYPINVAGIEIVFRPIYLVVFVTAILMMWGL
ncbi:MAG: hypothetical protein JW910_12015, partial [Anaerolineae bacterium]|nr:hypothetical protein [Anaerolineae bacterium]